MLHDLLWEFLYRCNVIAVWVVLLLYTAIFFIFISGPLLNLLPLTTSVILLLYMVILAVSTLGSFTLTAYRNPGFLLPNITPLIPNGAIVQDISSNNSNTSIDGIHTNDIEERRAIIDNTRDRADVLEVIYAGEKRKISYCNICHVYKPPKAFHCKICNCCCYDLDHVS